jgi:hypothetical protein
MEQNGQGNTTPGQGEKQAGLSWSQPSVNATSPLMPTGNNSQNQKPGSAPANSGKPAQAMPPKGNPNNNKSKNAAPATSNRTGMIVGAIVVVVLLLGAWIVWGGGNSTAPDTVSSTQTGTQTDTKTDIDTTGVPSGASAGVNSLSVASPQDAGLTVAVTSATVSIPTWVVVYESSGGQPGRALGATLFFPAQNGKAGTVSLLRATQPNQSYFVGLNADTGNDRVFSLHGDMPVMGADGKAVWYTFTTR